MPASFDLRTQPWIPVSNVAGQVHDLSLTEILTQAHEKTEISSASPLETAALLRLLLAVLYRAIPVPSPEHWRRLWDLPALPVEPINAYLSRQDGLDLFGPKPFLQIGGMTMKSPVPLSVLATQTATGNNATLFDHHVDESPAPYTPAQAARMVVAAQAFALGFGRAAEAVVDGSPFPRPYLADAISLRGVTLFLTGKTLRETLLLNLTPHEGDDRPPWEQPDPLSLLDRVGSDGKRISWPARGAVDRYAWQSRMIRLLPDADGLVRQMYFTQGREADKSPGDPMKVYRENNEQGLYALNLNAGKATWRDLQTYLLCGKNYGTSILNFAGSMVRIPDFQENAPLDPMVLYGLNVIGLATDPGKPGKFLLWRHDRVSLPAALLASDSLRQLLNIGLEEAEQTAQYLGAKIRQVASRFLPPDGNPDPKDVAALADELDSRPAFWARLETHFGHFIHALVSETTAQEGLDAWRRQVEREASAALHESCRQLGHSKRALKATARVSYGFIADPARRAELKQKRGGAKTTNQGGTP